MISFQESLKIIENNVFISQKTESISVDESLGRVLSSDLLSKSDYPRKNLSAMDGAVIFNKDIHLLNIKIVGEIKAGDKFSKDFKNGEARLIYTGGPVPGKDKVIIPKENFKVCKSSNSIRIINNNIKNYIRKKGSDFNKNQLCLKKNMKMNIRAVCLAKAMNIKKVKVKKKPNVLIIVTGDELIKNKSNKDPLVISTNKIFLENIVHEFGGKVIGIHESKDDKKDLNRLINKYNGYDILITSGGISKGKYDVVKSVLKENNYNILFDRVSIKPGKPTTFGVLSNKSFFLGLPGNPVSCFTSLIFFFSKFINSFYGQEFISLKSNQLSLKNQISKNNHLTNFLRIKIEKNKPNFFRVFSKQDSSQLKILNESDGLLIRNPYEKELLPGTKCKVLLFKGLNRNQI